jgi:hypothetical protein
MTKTDISQILEGFTKLTETARRAVGTGIRDPFDLGVYAHIKMEANWSTGIYHGTAQGIAYKFGNLSLEKRVQRSMSKLRAAKLINYPPGNGRRGGYDVLVDEFEITLGRWKGAVLDAWQHGIKAQPAYVEKAENGQSTGRERAEDGQEENGEQAENGHNQDVSILYQDVLDEPAERSAARPVPLHNRQDEKDKGKDSGRAPTPQVSSVLSIPIDPLIIDTPWEQKNEDAFITWKCSYGLPYDLADFLLIDAKYGERIGTVLEGHADLPLIIKWARFISKDFRDLSDTTELREEFSHILSKLTNYIRFGDLTPRKLIKRIDDVFVPTFMFGEDEPSEQDKLEEEYINECDERDTEMDLLYPWAEDDARQDQSDFYAWEN